MKNIVLLITDTYRYDNIAGSPGWSVRTPYLDGFANERAARLSRCYTGSFPTIPHRTDLATGRLGWPHYGWQAIDLSGTNHIAALLKGEGYATQLICDCPHLFGARFNVDFDAALHNRGQEGDRPLLHLNDPIEEALPDEKTRVFPKYGSSSLASIHRWTNRYMKFESETFAARTSSTVVRWLEENCDAGPFFLWADFFDPHEPWDPPEYLVKKYDPDYDGIPMIHPNYGRSDVYTAEELVNLRAHYQAEAELVDRHLGRVIEKIDDLSLWDDTVVIVTTDHGMSIGEHGRTGKSNIGIGDERYWPLYPEVSHIPFMIAAPGIEGGKTLDSFFQPVDILPTVQDLAGVSLSPPESFEGVSLAAALRGEAESGGREYAVSGCNIKSEGARGIPSGATVPFLVTENWGYAPVGADGKPELYELSRDPMATVDVADDSRDAVKELHELFLDHLRGHGATDEALAPWGSRGEGTWAIDYE